MVGSKAVPRPGAETHSSSVPCFSVGRCPLGRLAAERSRLTVFLLASAVWTKRMWAARVKAGARVEGTWVGAWVAVDL